MIDSIQEAVVATAGAEKISCLRIAGGPPTARPISTKVRGNEISELREAVKEIKRILAEDPAVRDISDDDSRGRWSCVCG